MIKGLISLANRLDSLGHIKEADALDSVLKKLSGFSFKKEKGFEEPDDSFDDFDPSEETEYMGEEIEDFSESEDDLFSKPQYTGDSFSPEENLLTRLEAAEKLMRMSDEDFQMLQDSHPEAFEALFGAGTLTPAKRSFF